MSAAEVRDVLNAYAEVLLARGDYGRFFSDDIHLEVMGTDQIADGAAAAEQTIRYLHEVAFDANPELVNVLVDEAGAAIEAVFAGKHIAEFAGIPATGATVRVPYSVFYGVADGRITALRIYMSMESLVGQLTPAHVAAAG
ncbi:ester cyclase [Solirubrobacter soli]|uniref:ester cyclase n=1 Tax=Solirubrobacter soli TaxID=363832 RepID=UPI00041100B1|nr:ester cyclase [Solirubrobacter soli]